MMPASTSPVPAVASRSSPAVTTSTSPLGIGDDRGRALEQHDAPRSAASRRAATMRSAPGRCPASRPNSPSCGVSTVGVLAPRQQRAGAVGVPRQREQPVAVDDDRHRRLAATVARTAVTVYSSRPRPGPMTRAWKRWRSSSTAAGPVERRQPAADDLRRGRRVDAGAGQRHHAAAGALGGAGGEVGGAGHAGAAGDHPDGRVHLCAVGGRGRHQRGDVVGLDEVGPGPAGVEPDVDDLDVAGEVAPGGEQQPGLEGGERDRAVGGQHAAGGFAGEAVDAARDVDGEHGRVADVAAPATSPRKPVP